MLNLERATDSLKCTMAGAVTTTAPTAIVDYKVHFGSDHMDDTTLSQARNLAASSEVDLLAWFDANQTSISIECIVIHNADSVSQAFTLTFEQNGVDYDFWSGTLATKKTLVIDSDGQFSFP